MINYSINNTANKTRLGHQIALVHLPNDADHSQMGQPLSKLYRRKFALFPPWVGTEDIGLAE